MQRDLCFIGCIAAVVAMAPVAGAAVVPVSRLSSMDIYILCGNGPAFETYDDVVTETGLLASGPIVHDKYVLFSDPFWGSSDADVQMTQDISILSNGADGFHIDGALNPNSIALRSLAPSSLGADSIANARTDSIFEYVFEVTGAAVPWSLEIDATRNPTGGFAALLQNITGGGYSYLSPIGQSPIVDSAAGVLVPGEYRLLVRQNTNGLTTSADLFDSSTALFSLTVGEIPSPGVVSLAALSGIIAMRRRR